MKNRTFNILFYIPFLSQEFGGVRQYSAGILALVGAMPSNFVFHIYHDGNDPVIMEILAKFPQFKLIKPKSVTLSKKEQNKKKLEYYQAVFEKKVLKRKVNYYEKSELELIIEKFKIDIIHCPYQFIPEVRKTKINYPVKLITTMHDVQELHFPEFFTAEERANRAVNYMHYIRNSDHIIVSYQHIKDDIVKYFAEREEKISVLLLKMNNLWFNNYNDQSKKNIAFVDKPYLFYPANFWNHKNHLNLIRAILLLKNKGIIVNLVLTGDTKMENGKEIEGLIKELQLQNQIRILGIVDEETLYSLYQNAVGVVVPTKYEAGSFPLMESILMNIPVICSNVTSLPETIGNLDFIFNPNDPNNIADKVAQLWNDPGFREKSYKNNLKQQERLIDTKADIILKKIYEEIVNNA